MKRILITLSIVIFLILFSQLFVPSLWFDFVNGGGHLSSSKTKDESMKRGVYIGDVEFLYLVYEKDTIDIDVSDAWIEKLWRDGVWYWTTNPEDSGYNVMILTSNDGKMREFNIMNNRNSAVGDLEGLGCCCGGCSGTIRKLPKSDTIKYNILKSNYLDFSEENIVGEVALLIKRD